MPTASAFAPHPNDTLPGDPQGFPGVADTARGRERLHATVSAAIEGRILSGALKVGDRLASEGEIAREFGVSTRSVREAIQVLETKGLVQRRHGERTTVVREDVDEYLGALAVTVRQKFATDPSYLMQLMVARRMIETEVIDILCARPAPPDPAVAAAVDAMRAARDSADFAGFVNADAAFHLALVHSAGNHILSLIYDNLFGLINEVIQVSSRVPTKSLQAAFAEHADIYARLCAQDAAGAQALMRAQIDNSAAYLRLAIETTNRQEERDEKL